MKLVCVSTAAEWSARFLTIGPPRVKYSIAKNSLKAMGFRRIFLLRSKSYGDTRSASKMPNKGFFDTLSPHRFAVRAIFCFSCGVTRV